MRPLTSASLEFRRPRLLPPSELLSALGRISRFQRALNLRTGAWIWWAGGQRAWLGAANLPAGYRLGKRYASSMSARAFWSVAMTRSRSWTEINP